MRNRLLVSLLCLTFFAISSPVQTASAVHNHIESCYVGHNHVASNCSLHSHGSSCYCSGSCTNLISGSEYTCGTYSIERKNVCSASTVAHSSSVVSSTTKTINSNSCDNCSGGNRVTSYRKSYKCDDCGATWEYRYHNCPCGHTNTYTSGTACTRRKCPNGHGDYSSSRCQYIYPCKSSLNKHSGTYTKSESYSIGQTCDVCKVSYTSQSKKTLTYCDDCDALVSDERYNYCPNGHRNEWSSGSGSCDLYSCPYGHMTSSSPGVCTADGVWYECTGCSSTSGWSGGSHYVNTAVYACSSCGGTTSSSRGSSCGSLRCSLGGSYTCGFSTNDTNAKCVEVVVTIQPRS